MTRFYIYSSAKDELEIVESTSLEFFAVHEFDPIVMAFTGIVIDAADFHAALRVYRNPACGDGEYMMADEPVETLAKRMAVNSTTDLQTTADIVQARLSVLRAYVKMQTAAIKLREVNDLMNQVAKDLFKSYKEPERTSPEKIFKELSKVIDIAIKYQED